MKFSLLTVALLALILVSQLIEVEVANNIDRQSTAKSKLAQRVVNLASHGVSVTYGGKAYHFSAAWEHVISLKFPKVAEVIDSLPKVTMKCQKFSAITESAKLPKFANKTNLEAIHHNCISFRADINAFNLAIKTAYENLETKLHETTMGRSRRAFTLAAIIGLGALGFGAGLGIGTSLGRNAAQVDIDELKRMVQQQSVDQIGLTDKLVGLSKIAEDRTERIKAAMKELKEYADLINKHFKNMFDYLDDRTKANTESINVLFDVTKGTYSSLFSIFNMEQARSLFNEWDIAVDQVKMGYLPRNIMRHEDLKAITRFIESKLPSHLTLAFDEKELDMYYTFPFAKFNVKGDEMTIVMTFPLTKSLGMKSNKKIKGEFQYQIGKVRTYNIPCTKEWCYRQSMHVPAKTMHIYSDPKISWLISNDLSKLKYEVELSDINCLPSADTQTCWSFYTSVYDPTDCTTDLWEWNEHKIHMNCLPYISSKQYDFPVPVDPQLGIYILHKTKPKETYMIAYVNGTTEYKYLQDWSNMVKIPYGATISFHGKKYLGPVIKSEETFSEVTIPTPVFASSPLPEIKPLMNAAAPDRKDIEINMTQFTNKLQWNSNEITKLHEDLTKRSEAIRENLYNYMSHSGSTVLSNIVGLHDVGHKFYAINNFVSDNICNDKERLLGYRS